MVSVDLTPFGFTPTESRVYEVLLSEGPGTGYAIARSAGVARANAYSALDGLVTKGAARIENGHPKRFRPEPPMALLARISNNQGQALEQLGRELESFVLPASPTMVEIESPKGALQLLAHDIARANESVRLLAPAEAFPILSPVLRKALNSAISVSLYAQIPVNLEFVRVEAIPSGYAWPGFPLISVVDGRSAVMASRAGSDVRGHWSTAPSFVAAAQIIFDRLRGHP
jgi:HTH-type transcriptional regulator, sugar sensing transcriptional regulator